MQKNDRFPSLYIIASVILLLSLAALVYSLACTLTDAFEIVICLLLCISEGYGIFYLLTGCRKAESVEYFKWFLFIHMISVLAGCIGFITGLKGSSALVVPAVTAAAEVVCLAVLRFAKDLGQKKSQILSVILTAAALIRFVILLFIPMGDAVDFRTPAEVLLALVTVLAVSAKYKDKASRGSK